jgi:hypothetical protein
VYLPGGDVALRACWRAPGGAGARALLAWSMGLRHGRLLGRLGIRPEPDRRRPGPSLSRRRGPAGETHHLSTPQNPPPTPAFTPLPDVHEALRPGVRTTDKVTNGCGTHESPGPWLRGRIEAEKMQAPRRGLRAGCDLRRLTSLLRAGPGRLRSGSALLPKRSMSRQRRPPIDPRPANAQTAEPPNALFKKRVRRRPPQVTPRPQPPPRAVMHGAGTPQIRRSGRGSSPAKNQTGLLVGRFEGTDAGAS